MHPMHMYNVFPKSASSLTIASYFGLDAVVKLLLETGKVDVDSNGVDFQGDDDGRTPLWWAARNGHEAVVKLLLARGAVS
jgi:ankyrin repeat protein